MNQLVVTTFSEQGKILRSQTWDSLYPLGIGYPFQWIVERVPNGVRVRDLQRQLIETFSQAKIDSEDLLVFGSLRLKIHGAGLRTLSKHWSPTYVPSEATVIPEDSHNFGKLIGSLSVFLTLFLGVALVIPTSKPNKEELIPPQFAKLIMKPSSSASSSRNQLKEMSSSNQSRASTVVHAFQTKQVQHSVRQLFKGGVLSLLKKSDLLSGVKSQAALDTLFKDQSRLKGLTAGMSPSKDQSIQVGLFGGSGTANAAGVGYGKGDHAVVDGQGKSLVSLESADAVVDEGLTKDEVGKVIHEHLAEVRYCYESAMIRNPDIQGKLMVAFSIFGKASLAGSVKQAKVNSATLSDESIGECIVKKLTRWKFPKPRGGVDVAVNYPFVFKTLGKR